METIVYTTGGFLLVATLLPLFREDDWWIRIFDFPRVQIAVLTAMTLAASLFLVQSDSIWKVVFVLILLAALAYQLVQIFPYTPFHAPEALSSRKSRGKTSFSLVVANVLMSNRRVDKFLRMVAKHQPDLLLVIEPDFRWERQLRPLAEYYPYSLKNPLNNTYGMLLYSKLPLHQPGIRFVVDGDVPSMHVFAELRSGKRIELYCLHPRPPRPDKFQDSTERDAELVIVGREIRNSRYPVVLAGDLNDVAWSYTTRLFQKISGLLDPRIGRGFYSTFHAFYPFFRWPLDHVFYSRHFKLLSIRRLEKIGSDHFPILLDINYEPDGRTDQQPPEPDEEDYKNAKEILNRL